MDRQLMELNTRFKDDTYSFMEAAAACMPHSSTFGEKTALQPVTGHLNIAIKGPEHAVFSF